MTSQKFSDKSFSSMLKTKSKSAFLFPLIGMAVLLIYTVFAPFSIITSIENNSSYYATQCGIKIENIRYIFTTKFLEEGFFGDNAMFLHVVLIIAAILCAITVFRDLSSKRTANIYYSLGFSRKGLFLPTYLAGAACVTGMVAIPHFLSFIINAFAFGITKEMIIAISFSALAYMNMALVAYTIASIAMIMSGMLFEGIFFGFFLNGIPSIIAFSISLFSSGLLVGANFTTDITNAAYPSSSFANALESIFFGKLSVFNSLAHSFQDLEVLGSCLNYYVPNEYTSHYITIENWNAPNWIPVICWSVVLAGLFFLSMYLFEKKKPEDIGFFASSKAMYRVFITVSVLGLTAIACSNGKAITKGLTWLYILILLAVLLVLTFIFKLILTKVARFSLKEEGKYFLMYAGVTLLVATVFSTGFFGYINRIPAVEKVKSVEVTSLSSCDCAYYSNHFFTEYIAGDFSAIMFDEFNQYGYFDNFKIPSEISEIQNIHKMLIKTENARNSTKFEETKIGTQIFVKYNLKNGKTLQRLYYYVTPQIIEKYAKINTASENIKEDLASRITPFLTMEAENSENVEKFITVFSSDMLKAKVIELTQAQRIGLVEAYRKDISSMTALEILDPNTKTVGALTTRINYEIYDDEGTNVIGHTKDIEFEAFATAYLFDEGFVFIKENMKNTVQWAKDNDVYELMQINFEEKISVIEVTYNDSSSFKSSLTDISNINLIFQTRAGRNIKDQNYWEKISTCLSPLTGSYNVNGLTDNEIKVLRENAQPFCITNEKGYFIRLVSSSGTDNDVSEKCSVLFIPESKLTKEMKVKFESGTKNSEQTTQRAIVY